MSRTEVTPGSAARPIVDQHEVSRAAIRALLQTEGLEVVADVSTGEQALALADEVSPDIVIIDVGPRARRALELAGPLVARSARDRRIRGVGVGVSRREGAGRRGTAVEIG